MIYHFYYQCKRRYNIKLWRVFCDVSAASLAPPWTRRSCIHAGRRPAEGPAADVPPATDPEMGMLCTWSDPDVPSGWGEHRGVSYTYGMDVVADFLAKFDFDLVFADQVVENGHGFSGRAVVTVFSAPNYCGGLTTPAR